MKRKNLNHTKYGFTLLELVVVLAILAIVTAIATREIGQVQDQQRYQATQRGWRELEDAIFGSPDDRAPDGTPLANGFVSDMGGMLTNASPAEYGLSELYMPSFARFGVREATSANGVVGTNDPEVLVPGGWRGPYVRQPAGTNSLVDGYGRPFTNTISRWSDHEISCSLKGSVEVLNGHCTNGCAAVTNAVDKVIVRVFSPDANDASKIMVRSYTNSFVSNPVSWEVDGLTMGHRVVRAYFDDVGGDTTRFSKSGVKDVILRAGTNQLNLTVDR